MYIMWVGIRVHPFLIHFKYEYLYICFYFFVMVRKANWLTTFIAIFHVPNQMYGKVRANTIWSKSSPFDRFIKCPKTWGFGSKTRCALELKKGDEGRPLLKSVFDLLNDVTKAFRLWFCVLNNVKCLRHFGCIINIYQTSNYDIWK